MHKKYYSKEELKIYYFTAGPTFPFQYQIFNKTNRLHIFLRKQG